MNFIKKNYTFTYKILLLVDQNLYLENLMDHTF